MTKIQLQVTEDLSVMVIPSSLYEFMIPTEDVARGYGVSPNTVRFHKHNNTDEIIEGTHFLKGTGKTNTLKNAQPHQIFWTKAGIIRLGFFIKSQKAKQFRNWTEKLILSVAAKAEEQQRIQQPRPMAYLAKNNHDLANDFTNLMLRELLKVESRTVRTRMAGLIDFYTSQIQ